MPQLRWRHCILNSRCSWLHGDERGFRSRDHRIHSSGDYKNPPPKHEHKGLREWHRQRSGAAVEFQREIRIEILSIFILKLRQLGFRVVAGSIGQRHLHALTELPHDLHEIRKIVGKCKQRASHAVRNHLAGSIWSEGGEYKWIADRQHLHNVYHYIRTKQERGTVVWSHRRNENWIDHRLPVKVMP